MAEFKDFIQIENDGKLYEGIFIKQDGDFLVLKLFLSLTVIVTTRSPYAKTIRIVLRADPGIYNTTIATVSNNLMKV